MRRAIPSMALLWISLFCLSGCGWFSPERAYEPVETYGEFPFQLTYELDGEIHDIQDAVVCEFLHVSNTSGEIGRSRKWKQSLKSGADRITLLQEEHAPSAFHPDRINEQIEIYYSYGYASYFMGDPRGLRYEKPRIWYNEVYKDAPNSTRIEATPLTEEQLEEHFGIRVIDWTYAEPISNTFTSPTPK